MDGSADSDYLHIEQLEIWAHLGVPEEERADVQRLAVSITLWPREPLKDLGDDIGRTINYAAVAEEARVFARETATKLIETLAEGIAQHLLQLFPLRQVRIELRKFVLSDAAHVSVTLTRQGRGD